MRAWSIVKWEVGSGTLFTNNDEEISERYQAQGSIEAIH